MKPRRLRTSLGYHVRAIVTDIRLEVSGWLLDGGDRCRAWWRRHIADDEPRAAGVWMVADRRLVYRLDESSAKMAAESVERDPVFFARSSQARQAERSR